MKIYKIAAYGTSQFRSPFIERVLKSGIRFEDGHFLNSLKLLVEMGKIGTAFDPNTYYANYGSKMVDASSYKIYTQYISFLFELSRSDKNIRSMIGDLLKIAQSVNSVEPVPAFLNEEYLKADLDNIFKSISYVQRSTRKEQYPMFKGIYEKFKNSMMSAASSSGENELANVFQRDAIFNPQFFEGVKKIVAPFDAMSKVSDQMVKYCMSNNNVQYVENNFHMVKDVLMRNFSPPDREKLKEVEKRRQEFMMEEHKVEHYSPIDDGGKEYESISGKIPYDPSNQELLTPLFITSIVVFFSVYRTYLERLPS